MTYWEIRPKSYQERINMILLSTLYDPSDLPPINRKVPKKKLPLQHEFLLMRLHLGLLQKNLAWRFQVSDTTVSKDITTWTKLLSKEFSCLITWPSRGQIYATLYIFFKKMYPKCSQKCGPN